MVDALQAEVVACSTAVNAAIEQGMGRVIIETDSLVLQQVIRTDSHRLPLTGD